MMKASSDAPTEAWPAVWSGGRQGRLIFALLLLMGLGLRLAAHEVGEEMAERARGFIAALTPGQQDRCVFAFADLERGHWHFVPQARRGLPFKEMEAAQRHLAHGLLASALSHRGYGKATAIMSLEHVLQELEAGRGPVRDAELYYFSVFGQPDVEKPWGWRVEGHHLSIHVTLVPGGEVAVTPSFRGSNPAEVRQGGRKGLRVLGREEDLARALVRSLTPTQREVAVVAAQAPADILTWTNRWVNRLEPMGLPASRMTPEQAASLRVLVEEYVGFYRPEVAEADLRRIEAAGFAQLSFAWAGGLEPGQPHYYRIQGPTFVMEYDNTQNGANHVHAVWRDRERDFGEDPLRRHYERSPHARPVP